MSQQMQLEPDLTSMSDWDNLNNEGKVYRKILEPGNGEFPQQGQRIEVTYVGNLLNGVQFDTNDEEDNPFIFILGKNEVIRGWDVVVSHMMKGEKALVRIHPDYAYGNKGLSPKIPANAWLEFTIKLLDFTEINKEIWEMELYEKVLEGNKHKEAGNGFFKQQNFEQALQQYNEGIKYIEDESNDPEEKELYGLKLSLYSNASLMSFKLKDWSSSIKNANKVLEIEKENTKALYRRAQASMSYGLYREAKEDCIKIIKIEPNNKEFRNLLEQIKQNELKANENEKKKFGKLFKDIEMYEEKERIPPDYIPGPEPAEGNPIVFIEIQVAENQPRRLEIELFKNIVPKTAENFRALCTGEKGIGKLEKPLHYKGCVFHRLVKGFMMQGGDITQGNGIGGESIYGKKFNDENFRIKHYGRGVLSMANKGPNTNSSQIFLNFKNTPHLDGKHVVFGRIIKGLEYLDEFENVETNEADKPKVPVTIVNCGEVL